MIYIPTMWKMVKVLYYTLRLENWGSEPNGSSAFYEQVGAEEPTWRWDGGSIMYHSKRPAKTPLGHRSSAPSKEDDKTAQLPPNYRSTTGYDDLRTTQVRPSTTQARTAIPID